jgi:predicted site-specific integrase-resolvase
MKTIGTSEAARMLGISIDAVHKLVLAGKLGGAVKEFDEKGQGRWRIPASAVKARLQKKNGKQTGEL